MRFFQVSWQFRLINFKWTHTIIEQEFFAVFYGLPPTFRFFLPTPKAALAVLHASLPTRLQLFWRTTRIVLINNALPGNDTGVSGPRPIFIPNQSISISKGTGFRPRDIIVSQQRLNLLEGQGKIYATHLFVSKNVFHHDAPDKVLPPGHTAKKRSGIVDIE